MSKDDPVLRVVRGTPTVEELAALVTVVLGRARTPDLAAGPDQGGSHWVRSARPGAVIGGLPGRRGRDTWRSSALPR